MEYTPLPFSTTKTQKEKLTKIAKKHGMNRSWLMQQLLDFALKECDMEALKAKAAKTSRSTPRRTLT